MDATRDGKIVVREKEKELETKWYAVYTRPRFEKQVLKGLLDQGIEGYLPLIKTMRQWSDRKKMVEWNIQKVLRLRFWKRIRQMFATTYQKEITSAYQELKSAKF